MDTNLTISIIASISENGVIGQDSDIPWHLKSDLKHFATITRGHTVIVGRKTHESILKRLGHPLVDRKTIIITRQQNYSTPIGCEVTHSWDETIQLLDKQEKEVFVIGGAEIYRLTILCAKRIYLTMVHTKCTGDAFFPVHNTAEWQEIFSEPHIRDKDNDYDFTFVILERKRLGLLL